MIIGILQADSVMAPFDRQFGSYPDMFRDLLQSANGAGQLEFRIYDIKQGIYPDNIDECDGYLITGSRSSVYEDETWIAELKDYVLTLHQASKKLVGICFGHQLIATALGGMTEASDRGWGVGVHSSEVVRTEPFMTPSLTEFSLLVSHKDQVTRLPKDALLLAGSDFCPNAMFRIDRHILALQGHPEFCKDYSRGLMQVRKELLGAETHNRGIESLAGQTDEQQVARWILNFVEGD